ANSASQAVNFIKHNLWQSNRLLAVHKDGRSRFPAYLDDYVFLMDGLLELLQVRWNTEHLHWLKQLADVVLNDFQDQEQGGFFFTANNHEQLLYRPKTYSDEALPAGNGVAAKCLARLGFLLGDNAYIRASEDTLRSAWPALSKYPHAHGALLDALEDQLHQVEIVIIRGQDPELTKWQQAAGLVYTPNRLVFAIPSDCQDLEGGLADKVAHENGTVAYRCLGHTCSPPMTSLEAMIKREK
ncbi:MAG: thioredoxin domain-containing protein, partial [Pseudomonadota bacterium]